MKNIIALIVLLAPLWASAQKEIKPSLPKAEAALRAGKYDEAKAIIDATTENQAFMVDKKGQPSKSAAKAWYLKALIYCSLDTTKNKAFKSLSPDPFAVAKDAFKKAYDLDGGKTPSFINQADGVLPMLDGTVKANMAQAYLDRAFTSFNDEKDYNKALKDIGDVLYFVPNDTNVLYLAGINFADAAEDYDKALEYLNRYIENKGTKEMATVHIVDIYYDKKKDNVKALEAAKQAKLKFPNNPEFPKYELNIYLAENKYDLARATVLEDIKRDPSSAESWHRLGGLYFNLNKMDSAKIAYQKAVDLNPTDFQSQYDLAVMYYQDARKIKAERDRLGISAKDIARRKELFDQLQGKYKAALPYWERAQKLSPDDEKVLYTLADMYTSLVMDDKAAAVRKRMQALGYEN